MNNNNKNAGERKNAHMPDVLNVSEESMQIRA